MLSLLATVHAHPEYSEHQALCNEWVNNIEHPKRKRRLLHVLLAENEIEGGDSVVSSRGGRDEERDEAEERATKKSRMDSRIEKSVAHVLDALLRKVEKQVMRDERTAMREKARPVLGSWANFQAPT